MYSTGHIDKKEMRDQPKPTTGERPPPLSVGWHKMKEQERATTGEWTRESVLKIARSHIGQDAISDAVADAHNAALAAERESSVKQLELVANAVSEERAQFQQLRSQLAAAQAANRYALIKLDRIIFDENSLLSDVKAELLKVTDTAALDAAISTAQQPLVDALMLCVNTLRDKRIGTVDYMEGSRIYSDFRVAADKGDATLAKVKEVSK